MFDLLGLSAQHESVYRAMLQRPDLNIAGLSAHLGVEPGEVHAALDVLADLALIRLDPEGDHARPVRPQAGLTALLTKVEAEVAVRQKHVEATKAAIAAIAAAHDDYHQGAEGRVLEGIDSVRDRLAELAHTARAECLSFNTGGAQSPDTLEAEAPLDQQALQRGVQIRNVYQDSFRNDPGTLAHARWLAGLGGQSRTTPTLPMRLVIVDRGIALVPIDPTNPRRGALELHSHGIVAGLIALFEQVWQTATPFDGQVTADAQGLTRQERELLRLLAAGHTDESAARKLAISLRSVQRMMTSLTERLGAASRFQAGVQAASHGWV
ncbi:DNA-binding CsgD family transcriptional regulator/DNA-binding MarR family transcriptional regulator [Micromonospora luteifusca]|uniref:DNA-binding CsgD family transcriptional regulator/DNA-binding MarR family transcriptional regulator n=1 Tax=Micromonospora luteifusca TaxID=709860 RepID=A0ABS2LY56_9ACTN|nr:LuxR C-terminal-related transcriptional regulator [Micromonospora luteifusca]MBM7493128.1 DNA-binding CsgD family transcriptional regulator/DNA-binding MarR family transcriptional regulator [Micromonospora luteifusca]